MLPSVEFCGLEVTRLILGANPFGGYSHQNAERDEAMRSYYTVDRILETWTLAEAAGINAMVTNNESPHVLEAAKEYREGGGRLQWIAQVNTYQQRDMIRAMDGVIDIGCCALYIQGGRTDEVYRERDEASLRSWCEHAKSRGVPVGVAGHAPEAHRWVDSLDVVDFHAVCFFNCGSLHDGRGEKFQLRDMARAIECIQQIQKPCIGYKIMGAGRIDAHMAFEHAFESIKPRDVVNVGIHRGDKDDMVEENAAIVQSVLGEQRLRRRLEF